MGKVITIGREFGSNGRAVAVKLSEKLGIAFYDKELIALAAKKSKIADEELSKADEKRANPWIYSSVGYQVGGAYSVIEPINDVLFKAESSVIADVADAKDCIIVGRCSDYVLRHKKDSRHVFIYAPLASRIRTVMAREDIDEKRAKALIKKVDKERRLYHNFYTDRNWLDLKNYDISLDSSIFSVDEICDILTAVYETM